MMAGFQAEFKEILGHTMELWIFLVIVVELG